MERSSTDFHTDLHYLNDVRTVGLRLIWNFQSRTHVDVRTVEGGQTYNEMEGD